MTPSTEEHHGDRRSRLKEELQQNLPFRSKAHEAYLALLRTADLAKYRLTQLLEQEGVTFQQYNVLRILRGAGPRGLPTLEIGERMIERTPGVTRIVDRLQDKGWVSRERCTEDRRKVWCRITPEALSLLARLDPVVDGAHAEMFHDVDEGDLDQLIRTFDVLRGGVA